MRLDPVGAGGGVDLGSLCSSPIPCDAAAEAHGPAGGDHRLRRDAVPEVGGAADDVALDNGDLGTEARRVRGGGVAGGTAADDDEVQGHVARLRRRLVRRSGRSGGSACPGAACSTAWAHQPTVRLTANVGVNIVRGQPGRRHHHAGEELDVAGQRAVGLQPGAAWRGRALDLDGPVDEVAAERRSAISRSSAERGSRCGRRRGRSP